MADIELQMNNDVIETNENENENIVNEKMYKISIHILTASIFVLSGGHYIFKPREFRIAEYWCFNELNSWTNTMFIIVGYVCGTMCLAILCHVALNNRNQRNVQCFTLLLMNIIIYSSYIIGYAGSLYFDKCKTTSMFTYYNLGLGLFVTIPYILFSPISIFMKENSN